MEENNKENNKDVLLPTSIIIAAVLIAGSVFYAVGQLGGNAVQKPAAKDNKTEGAAIVQKSLNLDADRDVIFGDPKAPVTIVEYSDYQCPFCARFFSQTEPLLKKEYVETGKVKFVYRNFAFLGEESLAAAEAAECAKDQGKFWLYHDAIFTKEIADGSENNGNLNRDLFVKIAEDSKLDVNKFKDCFDGGKYKEQVQKDIEAAKNFGVNSTPMTYVNGDQIRGAQPYQKFKTIIDKYLANK